MPDSRRNPVWEKYSAMSFHERKAYRITHGGPPKQRIEYRNFHRSIVRATVRRPCPIVIPSVLS